MDLKETKNSSAKKKPAGRGKGGSGAWFRDCSQEKEMRSVEGFIILVVFIVAAAAVLTAVLCYFPFRMILLLLLSLYPGHCKVF